MKKIVLFMTLIAFALGLASCVVPGERPPQDDTPEHGDVDNGDIDNGDTDSDNGNSDESDPNPGNGDEEPLVYFFPQDISYDGPHLDEAAFDLPIYVFDASKNRYIGGGGAFSVGLVWNTCIDGDTSRFHYPDDVHDIITSGAKSTRYLNIDTPETWPAGREEEWGKPATEYVCGLLAEAESIVLQTDPGDNLLCIYGRLLAWIWIQLPGEDAYFLLNYLVVRQGLGEVKYLFGAGETDVTMYDGKTYTDWMWQAETLAAADGYGMHGALLDWYWDYENDRPHPDRWD